MLDKIAGATILSKLRTKGAADNKPLVEPGEFDVTIGGQKERFTLK